MSEQNYRPPTAPLIERAGPLEPRRVSAGSGWQWIVDGWKHFTRAPGPWLVSVLLLGVVQFAVGIIPLAGSIAGALLGPILMGGMMLGCHAQRQGAPFLATQPFAEFQRHAGSLALVGLLYLVGIVALVVVAAIVFGIFVAIGVGGGDFSPVTVLVGAIIVLLAVALMLPLVMAYWFAPALVGIDGLGAVEAMRTSFNGCLLNVVPFLVYSLIALAILIPVSLLLLGTMFGSLFGAFTSGTEPSVGAVVGMVGVILLLSLAIAPTFIASVYSSYLDIFKANRAT